MTVFVPNNHTDLFQPLDISVNKGAKSFLSEKYQEWEVPRVGSTKSGKYQEWDASEVAKQLENGVSSHDVKVEVKLSIMKPLHAKWVIAYYKKMQSSKKEIVSGFRKAHISDAFDEAQSLLRICENPFEEIDMLNS